jgi:outer membrane protein, heavy metal efflux system
MHHGQTRRERCEGVPWTGRADRVAALLVIAWALLSLPCAAQATPRTPPTDAALARLIEQSLSARPELAQALALRRAQAERVPQAGALPDPMLQIGVQNDGFTSIEIGRADTSYVSFMASQTLPWPGKRALREQIAAVGVTQADQVAARVRLSTEAEVRRAYLDLQLARDRLALLEQLAVIWQKSLGVARLRYEAGDAAQSDVLRAQLEQARLEQRHLALQAEERASVQALNRLRGHPLDEPIESATRVRDLLALAELEARFSVERALAESPELASARLARARAGQSLSLAEKSYYPDLTVGAGIMVRGELPPMWLLTLGAPVPIFAGSKQDRSVAENRALAGAAEQQIAAIEQLLRLRSAERRSAFSALRQMVELYDRGLLVQSAATAESTLSQYVVGKVSFASVLEANAGFIADQEGYLLSLTQAHRLLIAEGELSLNPTPLPAASVGGGAPMPGAGGRSMEPSVAPASGAEPAAPGTPAPAM